MTIFISIVNVILLLVLLKIDRKLNSNNIFSPGAIFIYFALLPAFSNLYFSFFPESFYNSVLSTVAPKYRDIFYVRVALLFTIFGNIMQYIGIMIGANSQNKTLNTILNKLFIKKYTDDVNDTRITKNKKALHFGILVYASGLVVYLIFLKKIGGLFELWQELHLRATKNAGLGYLQTFYTYSIHFGALTIMWFTLKNKQKKLSIFIAFTTIFILGSMGARSPVLAFLISALFMYHYLIKRVTTLVRFKSLLLALLAPLFIVIMLQFRTKSFSYLSQNLDVLVTESIKSLEKGFIARIGRLERDIVILKYFESNDFWWGKSYYGLIYAPIPRSLISQKPPNDTGMYLRVMAMGDQVTPPKPVSQLGSSSWPEGNLVGYMNWGFPGFLLLFFLSGMLYGSVYKYVKNYNYPLLPTLLFSMFAVNGPPTLTPYGIIKLIMLFAIIHILIRFLYLPFFKMSLK